MSSQPFIVLDVTDIT